MDLTIALLLLTLCAVASSNSQIDPIVKLRKIGFNRDPRTFSHEYVIPWARPFKPGYCESWEWHSDSRYAKQRMEVCKDLAGKHAHECDSPSGLCQNKCPYTNGTFPFWRIRNADTVPGLWALKTVQLFDSAGSKRPLPLNPSRGYASNFFGPGYYPSNAFDNNEDSIWVSNGLSSPGLNWIAYAFDHPVKLNALRLVSEGEHPDRTPSEFYVEASCEKYFKTFALQWTSENKQHQADKRFNRPRK